MKSFSDFILDGDEEKINEAGIARIARDVNDPKTHIGVITAHRGELTRKQNASNNTNLKHDLIKHGLKGWIQVTGHYIENKGTPQERKVKEKSFYVKHHDPEHLHKVLTGLGAKYKQDSILIKRGGEKEAKLVGTKEGAWPGKGKAEAVGSFHSSAADSPFFSTIRNKKGHEYAFREEYVPIQYEKITFSQ